MNLLELSKRHKEWLKMATKICGCSELAKDIVQDMYLKVGSSRIKIRKEYSNFIFTILKNIHLNNIKKENSYIDNNEVKQVIFIRLDYLREL